MLMDLDMRNFFARYVKGTPYRGIVLPHDQFLCRLTPAVSASIGIAEQKSFVSITSRCIKHLYDKKPAEEFLFLLDNLYEVVKYPEKIYFNKSEKRGTFSFVREIMTNEYFCAVEAMSNEIQVATAFRLRDQSYLKNYTLLWSWKDGDLPRNAVDPLKGPACVPQ